MYYYYCVSLFGVRPWWKRHLTKLQISQFAMGGPCASLYIYYHFFGPGCTETITVWSRISLFPLALARPCRLRLPTAASRSLNHTHCVLRCLARYLAQVVATGAFDISLILLFASFYRSAYGARKGGSSRKEKDKER
jgi:hypothetical protein